MMLVRSVSCLGSLALLGLFACGDDIAPADAGRPSTRDGGSRDAPDATAPRDAGFERDAGRGDAGPSDAGVRDGGVVSDAGVVDDPPVRVEQAGGRTRSVALADGLAYVGVGPRLTVWDIANAPTRVGSSAPLVGLVSAIAVGGDRAYVTTVNPTDSHLHVLDTSTVAQPVEVAVLRLGAGQYSYLSDVVVDGDRLYVADQEQGVFVLTLLDADQPALVTLLRAYNVVEIRVTDGRLYAVSQRFDLQRFVEAFDTTTLVSIGSAGLGNVETELLPGHLLLTRGQGAAIEDLSQLPTVRRLYTGPPISIPASAADESGVWLSDGGRLLRLDLSDPSAITASPTYGSGIWALTAGAAADERLVFVDHQGGLEVFDTTQGASSLGETQTGPCAYCYAATTWTGGHVLAESTPGAAGTIAVATPADLELVGRHLEVNVDFEDVVVDRDRAFVADWFTGIWAFDLSNATRPTPIVSIPTPGYPTSLTLAGDYVVIGEGTGGGALRVFDKTDLTELGSIPTAFVRDLAADETIVYVAGTTFGSPGGLYIYDVADPADIQLLAHYADCEGALGVAVLGARAVVGCEDAVHVLDVSTPAAPTRLSRWVAPNERKGGPIALDGDRFYVALEDGVSAVDISVPAAPRRIAVHPTAWLPRHVAVGRGRLIAAVADAGLYQWSIRPQP